MQIEDVFLVQDSSLALMEMLVPQKDLAAGREGGFLSRVVRRKRH